MTGSTTSDWQGNTGFVQWQVSQGDVRFIFSNAMRCVSSAPFNGGVVDAQAILNLKVDKEDRGVEETPQQTLIRTIREWGLPTPCVGLMTAAWMESFRLQCVEAGRYQILCAVTSGLANARRVGDPADSQELFEQPPVGTINLFLITDAPLSAAAQFEAFALLVEAKTAACYDHQVISPKSSEIATGTGTDVALVASPVLMETDSQVPWCGKHTLLGECIGRAAYEVVSESILACLWQ